MNTDQLVENARARFDHEAQKRVLKEKYLAKMLFAYAGGMWRAGPELQILLKTCVEPQAVILDLYDNPVRVEVEQLMAMSQQRWQEQMTAWLLEHQEAQKKR
jgi:hypothetical protein